MAHGHLDRLTALDASFLHQEGPNSHMHVGALATFEGPPPTLDEALDSLRMRLHRIPRYRQRLVTPPAGTGRPLWGDDPTFNLEYHVRHTALPEPGSESQLLRLMARILSQQLDRSKPLWEMWIVEGLEEDRFAIVIKIHHSMIDGIAGVDIVTVMFDSSREPPVSAHPDQPWEPDPEPSAAHVLGTGAADLVRTGVRTAAAAASLLGRPQAALRGALAAAEGVGELAWAGLNPAPSTPLNVPIGPHRRLAVARAPLADLKTVRSAFGGTINDVMLTVVSGALARWLRSRGVRTQGIELRAQVPVSVRTSGERGGTGNRLVAMRAPLPVYIDDPVLRLSVVKREMDGLKESKQAVGAKVLTSLENFAPPTILAQATRVNFSTRLFNLLVSNIPGPQIPLYTLGREMIDFFPVAFLARNQALSISIISYNGRTAFGLLADYDAMPDVELVGEAIEESLAELVELASQRLAALTATDRLASPQPHPGA